MNFKIINNDKVINCNIIKTFKNSSSNISYIIYTDGTKDEDGDLEIYASRYVVEGKDYILKPIENDSEWDLIDNVLDELNRGNR